MGRLAAVFVLSAFLRGGYSVTGAQETVPIAPDNSRVNVRDRDAGRNDRWPTIERHKRRETHAQDTQGSGQGSFTFDAGA
jgi:hypothetical protein